MNLSRHIHLSPIFVSFYFKELANKSINIVLFSCYVAAYNDVLFLVEELHKSLAGTDLTEENALLTEEDAMLVER